MTVNATEPSQFALEISGSLGPFLSPSHADVIKDHK